MPDPMILSIETFLPVVGTLFRVAAGEKQELRLVSVTPLKLHEPLGDRPEISRKRIPFSLIFEGDAGVVLPQRTYQLEHDSLQLVDIFLVPIGRDSRATQYEAIFN